MKDKTHHQPKSHILGGMFLCIFFMLFPLVYAQEPALGVSEGDTLVYKLTSKASIDGRTGRDTQYVKYVINSIPESDEIPYNITGNAYTGDNSNSIQTLIEHDCRFATIDSYPMIGALIIQPGAIFTEAPSDITEELYVRMFQDDENLMLDTLTVDNFEVLAKGYGYTIDISMVTEKTQESDNSFPGMVNEAYLIMSLTITGYYSTTGICLREDAKASATAYIQKYIDGEKWGSVSSTTMTLEVKEHIVPSSSTPDGLSESPWMSSGEWVVIGFVSVIGIVGTVYGIKYYASKKSKGLSPNQQNSSEIEKTVDIPTNDSASP